MHERLRTRPRSVEGEPKAPQPSRGRPCRRSLSVSHGKVLGKPGEQYIPPLITSRTRHVPQQSLTYPGWLMVVLLQELHDQPRLPVKVLLGCNETSQVGKSHRLVTHTRSVTNKAVTLAEDVSPQDAPMASVQPDIAGVPTDGEPETGANCAALSGVLAIAADGIVVGVAAAGQKECQP